MAAEGNLVSGGVMLLHTESEGKHSYEVKGFLNYNKGTFARWDYLSIYLSVCLSVYLSIYLSIYLSKLSGCLFIHLYLLLFSNGDKLIMINNKYMEDLTPRAFAELLVEGSPSLTIHHSPKRKTEECESEEISVHTKEPTVMRFSLMMVREEDLEATGVEPSPEWESEDIEDDCFSDDNLLLVSMAGTRFSMVVPRGCDPVNPCNCCGGMNCQFNEVVVLPATAEITFNSSRILKRVNEQTNVILKSVLMGKYVTPENQWMFLRDTMSAKITLYYYTATMGREGVPVVLNFTGTENFFCCTTKQGEDKKILTLVSHNKKDLINICPGDQEKWPLVFYMSSDGDNIRRFESALYKGWFIYTQKVDSNVVGMQEDQFDSIQCAFSIIIMSEKGSC
uniref:Interleukin-1 beta n=1 Tax=Cyprinus carpio TaxID=7962 RepID=A0A8C1I957_CYPCA